MSSGGSRKGQRALWHLPYDGIVKPLGDLGHSPLDPWKLRYLGKPQKPPRRGISDAPTSGSDGHSPRPKTSYKPGGASTGAAGITRVNRR